MEKAGSVRGRDRPITWFSCLRYRCRNLAGARNAEAWQQKGPSRRIGICSRA